MIKDVTILHRIRIQLDDNVDWTSPGEGICQKPDESAADLALAVGVQGYLPSSVAGYDKVPDDAVEFTDEGIEVVRVVDAAPAAPAEVGPKYTVGQPIWVYVNHRKGDGPLEGQVRKVGRTLVTAYARGYGEAQFRIDTGYLNDKRYGTGPRIRTADEMVANRRRADAFAALKPTGIEIGIAKHNTIATETLERLVDVMNAATS